MVRHVKGSRERLPSIHLLSPSLMCESFPTILHILHRWSETRTWQGIEGCRIGSWILHRSFTDPRMGGNVPFMDLMVLCLSVGVYVHFRSLMPRILLPCLVWTTSIPTLDFNSLVNFFWATSRCPCSKHHSLYAL